MSANTGLTHEKNTDAMGAAPRGAWVPQTELFTLWTWSRAGASPAAGAPGLCPSLSCRGPSGRGAQRPALALAIILHLFRRPSAHVRVPALAVPSLGAPASRSCRLLLPHHAGLPCPWGGLRLSLLSHWPPGAPGSWGLACSSQRRAGAEELLRRSPGPVLRSQQSLLPRPASPGAAGTSPAALHLCLSWD